MPAHHHLSTKGYERVRWPFVLLAMMFAISSGGLLWMMREALQNDRLAVRQRLTDVYRAAMDNVANEVSRTVQDELQRATQLCHLSDNPQATFAAFLRQLPCDSLLVLDETGKIAYPAATPVEPIPRELPHEWRLAERAEYQDANPLRAAGNYGHMAELAKSPRWKALNLQAQARCLARANDQPAAEKVLKELSQYDLSIQDESGRAFALDAKLRLIQWHQETSTHEATERKALIDLIRSYEGPPLHPDQRRFVMHELHPFTDGQAAFTTLSAEELAAAVALQQPIPPPINHLSRTAHDDCWQLPTSDGRAILLFHTATLEKWIQQIVDRQSWPPGVNVRVHDDRRASDQANAISAPLGSFLAGWRLDLQTVDPQIFDEASSERRFIYLLITSLLLATTLGMATWIARAVRHQLRIAKMKNDLVATVSHELKTPLASMRLLVDTLLSTADDPVAMGSPTTKTSQSLPPNSTDSSLAAPVMSPTMSRAEIREYLQMISNENARLTRLIDNFLSYSRMERGNASIACVPLDASEVVQEAVKAFEDTLDGRSGIVQIEVERPLPCLGDPDRLISALLNLLDNAWKYTGETKKIQLVAKRVQQSIHLTIRDNGVGIPARHLRRIFDPFFQTDRSLARTTGGCGLGLSIVESIARAHDGRVDVQSVVGEGSQFTLILPYHSSPSSDSPAT